MGRRIKLVGQRKSRALDRLISNFDRELQASIANTTVKANERRAGRGRTRIYLSTPIVKPDTRQFTDLAGKHRLGMVLLYVQIAVFLPVMDSLITLVACTSTVVSSSIHLATKQNQQIQLLRRNIVPILTQCVPWHPLRISILIGIVCS